MERKIGEIFEYNGEWYQCVKSPDDTCLNCDMNFDGKCPIPIKECVASARSDLYYVIFKKLEKVGKPYEHYEKFYQCYKLPMETEIRLLPNNCYPISKDNLVEIEIKQNKEDMEEKKLNLKPLDIQKAREGYPVCTRDGRKARVLCYDFKQDEEYPILVAVENKDGKECALLYSNDGISEMYKSSNNELVMFPEKKEGWINIYNADTTFYYVDGRVFETKDEAVKEAKEEVEKEQREKNEYIDTIRVEWEE